MQISPDQWILAEWQGVPRNATIAFTWLVMAILAAGSTATS